MCRFNINVLVLICFCIGSLFGMPINLGTGPIQFLPVKIQPPNGIPGENRIFWNAFGDFVQSSQFFPIEVNVPDTINNIYSGVSGVAQRFPLINRWMTGTEPRPYPNMILLVPLQVQNQQQRPRDKLMSSILGLNLPQSIKDLKYVSKKKPNQKDNVVTTEKPSENCTKSVNPNDLEAQKVLVEYLEKVQEHNELFKNDIQGNRIIVPAPMMSTYLDTNLRQNNDFIGYPGGGYGLYPLH